MMIKIRYFTELGKVKFPNFRRFYLEVRGFMGKKIVNEQYVKCKAIFIHIPKAAGRSVAGEIFGNEKPGHYYSIDYFKECSHKFESYYKFTFVRDPLDRISSSYHYLISGGGNEVDKMFGEKLKRETLDFEDFVMNWLDDKKIRSWIHFVPQYEYITIEGDLSVDYVGRFENIESDFKEICLNLDIDKTLKHRNKGRVCKPKEYSELVKEKIRSLYKLDYKLLGY
ncbi:sulfotransferase family 2 domain-containing protein [Vibrio hippocampi]|uniref:Sulfotransferase family protein n=1 Tax=Vibrio hippocampi TaxID=654686 RepID=A0ABM8ZLS4_9VIBR|nr:sulfotransferase family 2 domain-containing protein [Vibrio hippocampi]CAH0527274.1 hypothetical protein VHP8226_02602 [Vibrio hippocampi]